MGKALEYFCRVAKETDSSLVRAVDSECEFICEATRILYTPYAPSGEGLPPPAIRPEGLANTLGVLRTLFRAAKDAARPETAFLRVFVARYGYLLKYNTPLPKGQVSSAATPRSPQSKVPQLAAPPKPQSDRTVAKQSEPPRESRPADYRTPRTRSPRGSRRVRGARRGSRRSRSRRRYAASAHADTP